MVAVLKAAHHHPGARLDDGLAVDAEEHVHLDTVPESELTTGRHQDTIIAVPHEHGGLHSSDEDFAVFTVVNCHCVGPVIDIDAAVGTVLDLELLARYRA